MSEEFCDGVKILLKRMESNPEEFKDTDRWEEFTAHYHLKEGFWSHALNPAEIEALQAGMRTIHRDVFTKRVMAKLLEDKDEPLQGPYTVKEVPPGTWVSVSGAGGGGSGVVGSPFQNVYNATSSTSFAATLKRKLANL
jgi:hypothetical protein